MKKYDCIVLTDHRYVNDSKTNEYTNNVYKEDDYLVKALQKTGLKTSRLSWDNTNFDWSTTKSIIFRSTWDYFDRFDAFSKWLKHVSKITVLINPEAIIRWNIDKHYLLDLKNNGVPIAETYFIEKSSKTTLKQLHDQLNWKETVLKPCVSGGARHTYKLNKNNLEKHEAIFQELITNEAMMLSPFQYSIVEKGEVSLMVFNGKYTHSVLKIAKTGDFRVQDDYGGSINDYSPSNKEIEFAETTVKACSELPLYARVDIFTDNNKQLALLELELIEPELWFRKHPEAATILAEAIKEKLTSAILISILKLLKRLFLCK